MATLAEQLAEAKAAYHDLRLGKAVVEVRDSSGEFLKYDKTSKGDLLAYIAERKKVAKIPTIKRDLTALSQAAEYAIERQWAVTNPVTAIPKRPLRYKTPTFKRPSARSLELGI